MSGAINGQIPPPDPRAAAAPVAIVRVVAPAVSDHVGTAAGGDPAPAMVAPAGADPLREAVGRAAAALGGGRPVTVEGFLDAESGHTVYRVADQRTGDVLYQSPPDELLRLYANLRDERRAPPLVRVEA